MLAFSLGVFSTLAITVTVTEGNLFQHANFKKCFKGNILVTLYNLSFNKCSLECQARQKCAAANYWRKRKKCELVESTDTTPLQLTVVGDSCVSIAMSDLPEVDSCRECEDETSCTASDNQCNRPVIQCQHLTVKRGTVKGNIQHVGARIKVICDEHFKLEPINASPVCGANGSWTVLPRCVLDKRTHGISDNQITATSFGGKWRPERSRLNTHKAWSPSSSTKHQYIQYKFNDNRIVNEIITQGGPNERNWVTSFKIYYSADCASFTDYNETFNGNSDGNSHVSNVIDPAIVAKCVRVAPHTWNDWIVMRIELMGCSL